MGQLWGHSAAREAVRRQGESLAAEISAAVEGSLVPEGSPAAWAQDLVQDSIRSGVGDRLRGVETERKVVLVITMVEAGVPRWAVDLPLQEAV